MTGIDVTVDVLLVNYRTPGLTVEAVSSLAGENVAFWVRDNSGDVEKESLTSAAGSSPCHLVRDGRNTLYATGNNEIFQMGAARYVLLLNPDVVLSRHALRELLGALGSQEDLWAVVPRLFNSDGSPQDYYRRFPGLVTVLCDRVPPLRRVFRGTWGRHVYAGETFDTPRDVEAPPGACLLVDRLAVGDRLFDGALSLFYNDTDLCLRMARKGWRIALVPSAPAIHVKGASLARARETDRYAIAALYDANCLTYARKHLRGWPLIAAVIAARRVVEMAMRSRSGA